LLDIRENVLLDIRENVEWPRFFWPTLYVASSVRSFIDTNTQYFICVGCLINVQGEPQTLKFCHDHVKY